MERLSGRELAVVHNHLMKRGPLYTWIVGTLETDVNLLKGDWLMLFPSAGLVIASFALMIGDKRREAKESGRPKG